MLALLALAVLVIGAPLRPGHRAARTGLLEAERADLEAARDAKYAEIRDAEMDYRTGKLSEPDWRALDRQLRREAVELLHRLDALDALYPGRRMYTVLSVAQVFISVVLIFLVLLHSGKDAGMSGAFGVGVAGGSTGGSLMERNLDRWTILFAVLFALNTIALLKV